jgi:cold shock CspA family protein
VTRGRVKRWNAERKFGFIVQQGCAADVFVHISDLADGLDCLVPDQRVEFWKQTDAKDGRARDGCAGDFVTAAPVTARDIAELAALFESLGKGLPRELRIAPGGGGGRPQPPSGLLDRSFSFEYR